MGVDLENTVFSSDDMSLADFSKSNLKNITFSNIDLPQAHFHDALFDYSISFTGSKSLSGVICK
ncbi:pentapeptide repeat-containing protein [Francisella hispaniensis]|uniref:pentapeptide repeat-containing protein n=1 Tax=Francisella hispaniensis TaxID=622488 RepID=UPI003B849A58